MAQVHLASGYLLMFEEKYHLAWLQFKKANRLHSDEQTKNQIEKAYQRVVEERERRKAKIRKLIFGSDRKYPPNWINNAFSYKFIKFFRHPWTIWQWLRHTRITKGRVLWTVLSASRVSEDTDGMSVKCFSPENPEKSWRKSLKRKLRQLTN